MVQNPPYWMAKGMQQPPKKKRFQPAKRDFSLFWMSQCVACHPAGQILYHVTVSCKGPIPGSNKESYGLIISQTRWRCVAGYRLPFLPGTIQSELSQFTVEPMGKRNDSKQNSFLRESESYYHANGCSNGKSIEALSVYI